MSLSQKSRGTHWPRVRPCGCVIITSLTAIRNARGSDASQTPRQNSFEGQLEPLAL